LTFLPKYDKLLLQPTKEKIVDYPIPASVTEYTDRPNAQTILESVAPMEYDKSRTIVINKHYYGTPEYALVNAEDVSMKYWRHTALTQRVANYESSHDKAKDYLVENFEDIGEDYAKELASILNIDLSKEVEVEFNVTIKATITIPVNEEVSDLSTYDFDVEISSNNNDYEIEQFDADIDSIDERY
jgi:hypothetical protein